LDKQTGFQDVERLRRDYAAMTHFMCIGIDTRNEAENHGEKRVFIGVFEDFDPDKAQRSSLSEYGQKLLFAMQDFR
jgi:hypothetical protein